MYELTRISLANWNLMAIQDIEISGTTALIGAVGVGKSTILDAIQTVFSGNMSSKLRLNRAASMGTGKSKRTVRDYCLGITEETLEKKTYRPSCHSILVLTFQSTINQRCCAVGLVIEADVDKPGEEVREKFVAPDCDFSFSEFADRDANRNLVIESYERVIEKVRSKSGRNFQSYVNSTGHSFIKGYLAAMKPFGAQPDVDTFTRRFRNAIAFEEITDPDRFIKDFVLEEDPIDTDRLRKNLAAWDELALTIERLEKKLREARQVRGRFAAAVSHEIEVATAKMEITYYNGLITERDLDAKRDDLEDGLRRREALDARTGTLRDQIASERESLIRDEAIARSDESGGNLLREQGIKRIEAEMRVKIAEIRHLPDVLKGLLESRGVDRSLPAHVKEARDRAEQVRRLVSVNPVALLDDGAENDLQAALQEIRASSRFLQPLATLRAEVVGKLGTASNRVTELKRELALLGSNSTALSRAQEEFRKNLNGDYGIRARVLAEVVDVKEGMEDWALALETVLGANKRAFFVDPDNVEAALGHLDRGRENYGGEVVLIDTRKLERQWERRRDPVRHAIVDIVATEDRHVAMFLQLQYGTIQMADDLEALRKLDDGVTRNGTRSRRFAYTSSRIRERRTELGRRGSQMARWDRQQELQQQESLSAQWGDQFRALEALETSLRDVVAMDLAAVGVTQQGIRDLHRQLREEQSARAAEVAPEVAEAMGRVEARKKAIASLQMDLDRQDRTERQVIDMEIGRNGRAIEELERSRVALADKLRSDLDWEKSAQVLVAIKAFKAFRDDRPNRPQLPGERHAQLDRNGRLNFDLNEAKQRTSDRLSELGSSDERKQRARSDFSSFISEWRDFTSLPEMELSSQFGWLVNLVYEIEQNELLPHKGRIARIQRETSHEVREIFVTQLHDKFIRVREIIRQLNRRLRNHRFGGQTYVFSQRENAEMAPLLRLVREVSRNPREAEQLLSTAGGEFAEALDRIRDIFRASGNAGLYEDYRQYYRFDLAITNDVLTEEDLDKLEAGEANGPRVVTNLTQRLGTGSGGQKQTPYYVAIAASMAAAYHPGTMREQQEGMGLVCFDEAFSKLDIQSTQALIRFFKALGLQIIVAAPEEKRASFMELMDTIVNITKAPGEDHLFIDVETIGDEARDALFDSNPEHIGIQGFRDAMANDGTASAAEPIKTRNHAAE